MKARLLFLSLFIMMINCFHLSLFGIYHKIGDYKSGNRTLSLDIRNDYVYTIKNIGLMEILDVHYPEEPLLISSYQIHDTFLGGGTRIIVSDSLAYILTFSDGIIVIDISDHFHPQQICTYNYYAKDLIISDNYAYIACYDHLYILDISNSLNPILVGEIYGDLSDITYYDNKIYGVHPSSSNNLRIIDVTDPTNPDLLSDFDLPIYSDAGIDIKENTVFIAYSQVLWSIDVNDPSNPIILDALNIKDHTSKVIIDDNIAIVDASRAGFEIVDISIPENLSIMGFYDTPGSATTIKNIDTIAFVADGSSGIQVIDFRDAFTPDLVKRLDISRIANSIDYKEDYLYVGNDNHQIKIYSVYDPENSKFVSSEELFSIGGNTSVKTLDDIAYCTTDYPFFSLNFVDISDPINPNLIGYDLLDGYVYSSVCVNNSYAFVGIDNHDLFIYYEYDLIGEYEASDGINDITANEDLVFLALGNSGIEILNINNNIHNPILAYNLNTRDYAHSVAINDSLIFISDGKAGILIFNITNPEHPTFLTSIKPNNNSDIATKPIIIDNLLYFFDREWNELFIYNVTIPEQPTYESSFKWNTSMKEFQINNNILFSADSYYGISIIDLTDYIPDQNRLYEQKIFDVASFPNPFNSSTTIVFSINQASFIEISIYNIKGQKIKTLLHDEFIYGTHSISWDGNDDFGNLVSTGLYLYKISINGKTKLVNRCIYLK